MDEKDDGVSAETSSETKDKELESKLTRSILKLEEIDKNLYRANYLWRTVTRGVFGGQIIGQALVAASQTVPEHLHVHSMHCYFLQKGDGTQPIIYHVDNMRDGSSFSTRLVKAVQKGENIFTAMVSYHKHEPALCIHQYTMPNVPPPESLATYEELLLRALTEDNLSDYQRAYIHYYLADEVSFHLKPVYPDAFPFFRKPEPAEPKMLFWVKVKGDLGESAHNLHRCIAAYISDSYLLGTSMLPVPRDKMVLSMMASLDHTLWFHTHFRADDWLLYECESPRMIGNRALSFGRIWLRDGVLAVSCAQEGIVRLSSLL
jgi:acyl-CoA thioesterase 8